MPDKPARLPISERSTLYQATSSLPGSFGRYRLLERVGEGGLGEVWLAEQTTPVHRQVAVKVIKAGMDSAQVVVCEVPCFYDARIEADSSSGMTRRKANLQSIEFLREALSFLARSYRDAQPLLTAESLFRSAIEDGPRLNGSAPVPSSAREGWTHEARARRDHGIPEEAAPRHPRRRRSRPRDQRRDRGGGH